MRYRDLFGGTVPVMAMVHMKGDSKHSALDRAKQEIDIFLRCGVEALLVENYFGSTSDVEHALRYLRQNLPNAVYGVNVLGDEALSYDLAESYGASFIQIDSVSGHLFPQEDTTYAARLEELRKRSDAVLLGGVRFKYQPIRSGRSVEQDVRLGMQRCDAIVVTGEGTGMQTPESKVRAFRAVAGDFPLVIGAGMAADRLSEAIGLCDGFIVGSWFKEQHSASGEVFEPYVREFMNEKRRLLEERCQ